MIEQLKIKNFMAFSDEMTVNFSPKINVIIGENGTGKTQLLKAIFLNPNGILEHEGKREYVTDWSTERLIECFLPIDRKLGKLHHTGAQEQAQLDFKYNNDVEFTMKFHNNSQRVVFLTSNKDNISNPIPSLIPTKEVLSFAEGFVALHERFKLSFDLTYREVCILIDHPALRPENLQGKSKWAMEEIEKVCGGKFIFYGGGRVTFKTPDGTEYSANAIAEGFRKIGILARHLETGIINPGVSGPLLWDEPEANMNPKIMRLLVQILLELSQKGQQVILTTHEYVVLKWFDLLMDKVKGDEVRYHTLYRDKNDVVQIKSTDDYRGIVNNPISQAFTDITVAHAQTRLKGV